MQVQELQKKIIAKIGSIMVNLVHKDTLVNLCKRYAVENTTRGEKVMILNPGAPVTLAGRLWLEKYLFEFDYKIVSCRHALFMIRSSG